MKTRQIVILTFLIVCAAGCKKEDPVVSKPADLLDVDLTGEWNGYKYNDLSGIVPLEIIQITRRNADSAYYIATKITGDNGVPAGKITWEGNARSNPFPVDVTSGDGAGNYTVTPGVMQIEIVDQNTLRGGGVNLFYVRRTDSHF